MKKILITGASSGIGKATALAAAEKGWNVVACGRNAETLQQMCGSHENIQALVFDVTDIDSCRKALATVCPDIIVLNAGVCEYVDVDHWNPELFKRVFDANFFGAVNCLDVLLPKLEAGNQLVFVDSLARLFPFTRSQAYGASKSALHYLAKCMEVDLAHRGVVVQTVSPGFVKTPLTDQNDFHMPMRVEVEEAAAAILSALESQKHTKYFPRVFSLFIRTLSQLPMAWQVALSKKMKSA